MTKTKTLTQHENNYWYIPKFNIYPIICVAAAVLAIKAYFPIFINEWNAHNISLIINCVEDECLNATSQFLGFLPQLIFAYALISLAFISSTAAAKGGFDKLKGIDEKGLIYGLISGLTYGLIFGLTVGLISGLTAGLIIGLISGLIAGLIIGLTSGLKGESD